MKIEKAIKELEDTTFLYADKPKSQKVEAMRLGIEALKCIQRLRGKEYFGYSTELPGETKE